MKYWNEVDKISVEKSESNYDKVFRETFELIKNEIRLRLERYIFEDSDYTWQETASSHTIPSKGQDQN